MTKNKLNQFTTREVAQITNFTGDYIRQLIYSGTIKAAKFGNSWMIDKKELKKIKRQRNKFSKNHILSQGRF